MAVVPWFYKVENGDDGVTEFYVANLEGDQRPVSFARAKAHTDWYDEGTLPKRMGESLKVYSRERMKVLCACMISVRAVDSRDDLTAWARTCGDLYQPYQDGQLYNIHSSNVEFWHTHNISAQVIAMAAELGFIDLVDLQDGAQPLRAVGRPKRPGCALDKGDGKARPRTAGQVLDDIRKGAVLRLHRHKVAIKIGRGQGRTNALSSSRCNTLEWGNLLLCAPGQDTHVGYVSGCHGVRAEGKPAPVYKTLFPDLDADVHELSEVKLANALVLAREIGASGIWE